jgi:hypothetical protein
MHIKLNLNDEPLIRGFKDFGAANKQAIRNTLNIAVSLSRRNAIENIRKNFTLRNTYTEKSIAYDKADQSEIKDMQAAVGARPRAYYLETQEEGGLRKKKDGKTGPVALPMREVRGGRSMSQTVTKSKYISKIKRQIIRGKFRNNKLSVKARNVASMFAAKRLNKYIKRGSDIFSVIGIEKIGRNRIRARLAHLYSIDRKPIRVRARPWLQPAIQKPARDLPYIYRAQLKKQWKTGPEKL